MSSVPPPTYEQIMALFLETREQMKNTDRQVKRTSKAVGALTSRIGRIIENMVGGDIVTQFQSLGYTVTKSGRNVKFGNERLPRGEIDLFLENGDVAILIEVKTTLETKDVRNHVERMEKYRSYAEATNGDKRRFLGAVAGAIVEGDAEKFAHENGLFVIIQSGKAVEIVTPPEGFVAKEW